MRDILDRGKQEGEIIRNEISEGRKERNDINPPTSRYEVHDDMKFTNG